MILSRYNTARKSTVCFAISCNGILALPAESINRRKTLRVKMVGSSQAASRSANFWNSTKPM